MDRAEENIEQLSGGLVINDKLESIREHEQITLSNEMTVLPQFEVFVLHVTLNSELSSLLNVVAATVPDSWRGNRPL